MSMNKGKVLCYEDTFCGFLWQVLHTGGHFWSSIMCDA